VEEEAQELLGKEITAVETPTPLATLALAAVEREP
jgi:hypothetical protein